MNHSPLDLGAVFLPDWDDRPIRVIAFDERELMYDVWWKHDTAWGMSSLSSTAAYYRLPTDFLLTRAKYLRTDAYSPGEWAVHRPDLPLAFAQSLSMEWSDFSPDVLGAGKDVLKVPEVYLSPFGPRGGFKPGVLVSAKNGKSLSVIELLSSAKHIQAPLLKAVLPVKGVGIYRSGIMKGLPWFQLWGGERPG